MRSTNPSEAYLIGTGALVCLMVAAVPYVVGSLYGNMAAAPFCAAMTAAFYLYAAPALETDLINANK